jgi:hypothetical protein
MDKKTNTIIALIAILVVLQLLPLIAGPYVNSFKEFIGHAAETRIQAVFSGGEEE